MWPLLVFCGAVCLAQSLSLKADDVIGSLDWEKFKSDFSKIYNDAEDTRRREIWELNVKYITQHNHEADKGEHSYWLGVNRFADWTDKERLSLSSGTLEADNKKYCIGKPNFDHVKMPDACDWRTFGYITPVKNQGMCGSPWAFSVTGAIEAWQAIYCPPHQLVSLSEQNLLDCSSKYGNNGCNGGLMDTSYGYLIDNGDIDTEASYPYEAKEGRCRYNPANMGARIRGCVDLPKGNETALQIITFVNGPVSVGVHSALSTWQFYKSGVYDDPKCTPNILDHAGLVVGYGLLKGKKYWIFKNSWGTSWGDNGYMLIARDHGNECGIANLASYPEILCEF